MNDITLVVDEVRGVREQRTKEYVAWRDAVFVSREATWHQGRREFVVVRCVTCWRIFHFFERRFDDRDLRDDWVWL